MLKIPEYLTLTWVDTVDNPHVRNPSAPLMFYHSVVLGSFSAGEYSYEHTCCLWYVFFFPTFSSCQQPASWCWLNNQNCIQREEGAVVGEGKSQLKLLIGLNYGCCRPGSHNRKWKDGSLDNCLEFWDVTLWLCVWGLRFIIFLVATACQSYGMMP